MRRFGILLLVFAIAFMGSGAIGVTPRALGQEATPTAVQCPSPLATPAAAATAAAPPLIAEPVCVGVVLGDFFVRPEATTFRVGQPYIFAVGNAGQAVHEFIVEPADAIDEPLEAEAGGEEREAELEDIAPGKTVELAWTFAEPGRYQFACHVPGHYEAGMVAEIEVEVVE